MRDALAAAADPELAPSARSAFLHAVVALRAAGIASPETDARILLCHALDIGREDLAARPTRVMTREERLRFAQVLHRRRAREPVSRIIGNREFFGLSFALGAETLDPRPDSETLVEAALARASASSDRKLRVLDIGTGTGCLLLALLNALPSATGVGVDIAPGALAVAAMNAERLGLADRSRWLTADFLVGVSGSFDLVVANPPYIPTGSIGTLEPEVARFDPHLALDGGADGLEAYRRIAPGLCNVLAADGRAYLEIDPSQESAVRAMATATGPLQAVGVYRDLAGRARVVELCCLRPHEAEKRLGKSR